ncbi:protein still life, isoform SIF type 1 isoform X4 [Linepithema humile]|uniref:protein still life, isoform SIF type 1 isoform X4 n=1 Tax=Linepithema humile TaxID=83485 RepID=UPI000623B60E|nr:PREDICTED: protein still life, isoform SIF type 1 isoform X4 [Linepithema humile]
MGNKLSCSCAPLIRSSKTYRYEDSPWQAGARAGMGGGAGRRGDTGHLLRCGSLRERKRLWAEVFHVNSSGAGTVKWQQVSEDLVPVNITCIQDSPECVFHITAYNSQVDKILDVRLVQPGTRIGQASECFVYWKDTVTNDTWGLNFTSPIDAKQFRECCSPSFKISRKASSSYSLKLEPPNKQKIKTRRKPVSTPASPSRSREPQCTCMAPEQYARLRSQDPRYRSPCGPSTLPRTMARSTEMEMPGRDKITAATSSASLYDNVNNPSATPGKTPKAGDLAKQKEKQNETCQTTPKTANIGIGTVTVGSQIDSPDEKGSIISPKKSQKQSQDSSTQQNGPELLKSEGTQAGGTLQSKSLRKEQLHHTKSADYTELEMQNGNLFNIVNNNHGHKSKSKSTDDMRIENAQNGISLDSNTLKRMLKPMPSIDSPVTSPEMTRKRHSHHSYHYHPSNNNQKYVMQEVDNENYAHPYRAPYNNKFQGSRSAHDMSRQYAADHRTNHHVHRTSCTLGCTSLLAGGRGRTYLDSERNRCTGDMSPPSDNVIFDNQCYATTPSSSNGNSDMEQPNHCNSRRCNGGQTYQQNMQSVSTPGSPTSRLLLEYEMHLRNTLAKGMDAESYSLRTFEALLSQSMENLEFAENIPLNVQRTPHVSRRRSSSNKSSTLPLSYRYCNERQNSKDRDGYYSDRNEMVREKRERDSERDRGYLSDYNSRCASCIGESARAQWFRHSDGWQSGSSTLGSGASSSINPGYPGHKRESPWDSLPSLRHESSLNDSGYKSNRTDSLEQRCFAYSRGTFDRQDSVRSDYMSDRDGRYGIVQQASLESTDSRLCYLTSSEMSDDDRMSLTTAVSDDDDGESVINSPYRGKQTGTAAASFNCTGAVRKAGFLSVKKWLLRKKHQIELARKRGWKGYWVCLKGTTLLFYPCDSQESRAMEAAPKHLIIVDGAIMQPIPEHPKRDYIFCLSTAFGDAYLFQAPCQVELENWVNSIHSACAAAFARHRGKTGTLHLLQEEIFRLEKSIESDHKMKHMADLQQSVVSDVDTKQQINNQIVQWEENLERFHCEQFRLRCYMASLQSGELPNPKSLLTHVSRATKQTLNKLGVFTVSSFHAFICARSPSLLNNLLAGRGATKRRAPLLSRSNSGSSRRSLQISSRDEEKSVKVSVPENQLVSVFLRDAMTVEEFLASACTRKNLNPMEHFVRVKKRRDMEDHNYFVPHRTDLIETYLHTHEIVEVCAKILYQVELQRNTLEQMWGFSVEAELVENSDRQDELCCYVSRVEDKSVAMQNGIIKGDEIMVINGAIVSDLDMMYLESVLQEEVGLCMMMRSSRTEPPDLTGIMRVTDDIIESLVCPPPPSDPPVISEEMISGLIVPAPGWSKENIMQECTSAGHMESSKQTSRTNSFEIENLLKTAEQVTGICRSPGETRKSSPTGSVVSSHSQALTPSRQLSDAEKLKKVILELIETERTYVKNLNNLLENYLEPLKRETFLSNAEINALFGNIQEIVTFQRQFLQNLEHSIELEADFNNFDHPSQFKGVLFSIGSAFLYYVNHFKLYSSFCASHSKAQKVLHPNEGNQALQEFLQARNPRQQHSSTLESYLIKPIQRILKYPLLLQQLRNLTDERSEEHQHLIEALKGMEKVAEHINEMQRIHEEYGAIFDHLFRQHQKSCKQPIDLSPGDLLYYGGVEWLNISDFLGKIKKGLELHAMCFVFKSAVVFLCKERLRQKKKLMGVSTKANSSEVEIIRYQVLIPVTEVQVRASSAKDMESHFLWELIHLRSQLQRRSEKVYVLSNSTTEFRNAFLKTIRQIIRESVRNMSIPSTKQNLSQAPMSMAPRMSTGHVEKFDKQQIIQAQNGNVTLSKKAMKQQLLASSHKRKYSQSKQPVEHESSEDKDQEDAPVAPQQTTFRSRSKTISDTSGEVKVEMDSGTKSEGEEDSQAFLGEKKTNLGRTPNHLTLSTTSTISAGSTGSQARLIQSSHQPENYQPITVKELGSPIWKPRELPSLGEATTLPRKGKSAGEFADMSSSHSASRKSLIEINNCAQQPNFNNHV